MHFRHVQRLGRLIIVAAIAVIGGTGSARLAIEYGTIAGLYSAPPWSGWLGAGSPDADPYTRAKMASGLTSRLNPKEGTLLRAGTDSAGRPLGSDCDYRVRGGGLPARLWTLSIYDPNGVKFANPSRRYGFHSREILRARGGEYVIVLSTRAHPGNWIALAPQSKFVLVLRLYDTADHKPIDQWNAVLPVIERGDCR
jgi:hypothetical protein